MVSSLTELLHVGPGPAGHSLSYDTFFFSFPFIEICCKKINKICQCIFTHCVSAYVPLNKRRPLWLGTDCGSLQFISFYQLSSWYFFPQSLGLNLKSINQWSLSSVSKKQRQAIWWSAINFYADGWDLLFRGIIKIDSFHKCINNSAGKNRCPVIIYNLLDILEGNSWTDRRYQSFKIKKKKKLTETSPQNIHAWYKFIFVDKR